MKKAITFLSFLAALMLFSLPVRAANETINGNTIMVASWGSSGWGGIRIIMRNGTYVTEVRFQAGTSITALQVDQCRALGIAAITTQPSNKYGVVPKVSVAGNVSNSLVLPNPEDGTTTQRIVTMDSITECSLY